MKPFDQPLKIDVIDGEVVLLGPDGISGSFTPSAAEQSAKLLQAAAERAQLNLENEKAAAETDLF